LEVDIPCLNFGTFTSNKILGSVLTLANKSNKPGAFTVSVMSEYPRGKTAEQLLEPFYMADLPYKKPQYETENIPKCWGIEHPTTKQLLNKVQIELEPSESKSIVIVCKAPQCMKPINMLSVLKVTQG